ncbi:hypothetical protein Tco_1160342 [Tanacetum coccineum]
MIHNVTPSDIQHFAVYSDLRVLQQARENLMETIQAFLKEYDHIPPEEKCMALLLGEERFLKIKQAMEEEQNQPEVMKDLQILNGIQPKQEKQVEQEDPEAQTEEPEYFLSMGDKYLDTISETESDKVIKSSVENLVPIPSDSEDFSDNESECDVPECDETSPTFTT